MGWACPRGVLDATEGKFSPSAGGLTDKENLLSFVCSTQFSVDDDTTLFSSSEKVGLGFFSVGESSALVTQEFAYDGDKPSWLLGGEDNKPFPIPSVHWVG
jgi:hypothetical protein